MSLHLLDFIKARHRNLLLPVFLVAMGAAGDIYAQDTRVWGTYYGGSGTETTSGYGMPVAVDASGNVFLAGQTPSTSGIASAGAFQTSFAGSGNWLDDAFLVKFGTGGGRVWATYYGGTDGDMAKALATDASGNVYMAGATASTSGIASGGFQNTFGGNNPPFDLYDAFLVKFDSGGNRVWATYYGGTASETANGVAVDASGNIYLVGTTNSTSNIATAGSYQTTLAGGSGTDAFLVKFNSAGARQWATYYGGTQNGDNGSAVAVDPAGNVYIVGQTYNSNNIASGGFQNTFGGTGGGVNDAFLVKFNSAGTRQWATYYGGSGNDVGYGVVADASGNIYMSGQTSSTAGIASAGAFQTAFGGGGAGGNADNFLVKFGSAGNRVWGTYYGGSDADEGGRVALDATGTYIFLSGGTYSTNAIATSNGFHSVLGGSEDIYVAKFDNAGTRICGTYYGDNTTSDEEDDHVAVDPSGNVYLSGETPNPANIASGGFQNSYGGGALDAFLVKLTSNCVALPVEFLSFTGKNKDGKNRLEWRTASERNSAYFILERSSDGSEFEYVWKTRGAGNSTRLNIYSFTDEDPLPGINYYRLSGVDYEGAYTYSQVIAFENYRPFSISVFPDPAKDIINCSITLVANSNIEISIVDMLGNTVIQERPFKALKGNNKITPDISGLSPGMYFISISAEEKQTQLKFVKQ